MGSRLIPFIGLSAMFLFAIIPQAQADLCGDTVDVVIKEGPTDQGPIIMSFQGVVPYSDFFDFNGVDVSFAILCDDDGDGDSLIFWDYDNLGSSVVLPTHSFWFNDLQWTDGDGFVTNFQVDDFTHETPSLMTTGFNSDSAHAIVSEFTILTDQTLLNNLILSAAHPVGGIGIPIDTTALLLASAQSVSLWMLPIIASGIAVGVFIIKKRS